MASEVQSKIFELLSFGEFISGQKIGSELNISRAAVSQHIKKLQNLGLDIYSVTGKGYKLASKISLLSYEGLSCGENAITHCSLLFSVDSTNDVLLKKVRNKDVTEGEVVLAECQLAGKGRRGRKWVSPIGSHVYFSKYVSLEDGLSAASAISLAVGLAVARTCMRFSNQEVKLKWPNDILANGKKLAGILVEAEGQSDGKCHLVIGIGLNVNMPKMVKDEIDQPWTDLCEISPNAKIDRNEIVKRLNVELTHVIAEYQNYRLSRLYKEWNLFNAYANQPIQLKSANSFLSGLCLGIDETGALNVSEQTTNEVRKIFGGEVSLRGDQ